MTVWQLPDDLLNDHTIHQGDHKSHLDLQLKNENEMLTYKYKVKLRKLFYSEVVFMNHTV